MYRTIVVGYDGTDEAEDGLALAVRLARLTGGRLLLAFAYGGESIAVGIGSASIGVRMRKEADEVLERGLRHVPSDIDAHPRALRQASAARALHELSDNADADLVVLGSAQFGTIGRVVIGSIAMRLLHGLRCPVAVAPKGYAKDTRPASGRIAVCWDGSPESELALDAAAELARESGDELHIWHAVDPALYAYPTFPGVYVPDESSLTEAAETGIAAAIERLPHGLRATGKVLVGAPAHSLVEEAGEQEADLLVTGSRGYGPLRRVLLGGVSSKLMRSAPCPVVIVPRSACEPAGAADAEAVEASAGSV